MDKEMKGIFRNNVIKFVIGIILLTVSFGYIQNHPAEKASIFSGFEVLRQRLEVFVYKVIDKDSEWLQTKFDIEKNFDELINTAKDNECAWSNILTELEETYLALRRESISDLENNLTFYKRKFSEYKSSIDKLCK